jgi:hypothetical protein
MRALVSRFYKIVLRIHWEAWETDFQETPKERCDTSTTLCKIKKKKRKKKEKGWGGGGAGVVIKKGGYTGTGTEPVFA